MKLIEFAFDYSSGLRISRDLLELDVASLPGVSPRDMKTGYVWYSIPIETSEHNEIQVDLCFHSGALDSISLDAKDAGIGRSLSDWSEDKERTRAKRTQDWLTALGYAPGRYSWGDIWAGYDPKSGSGSAVIRYNSE